MLPATIFLSIRRPVLFKFRFIRTISSLLLPCFSVIITTPKKTVPPGKEDTVYESKSTIRLSQMWLSAVWTRSIPGHGRKFCKDIRRAEQKIRHDFLRKLRVYGALQSAEFFRVGYPGFSDRRISASVERRLPPPFKNKWEKAHVLKLSPLQSMCLCYTSAFLFSLLQYACSAAAILPSDWNTTAC